MDYYKLKVLNNKKKIIIVIVILLILVIGYFIFINHDNKNQDILLLDDDIVEHNNLSNDDIYVDIKGYVSKPGVYAFKLYDNARVNDLINKDGGLLKDADTSTINLSKKLDDEMTIIIYSKNEIKDFLKTKDELNKKLMEINNE